MPRFGGLARFALLLALLALPAAAYAACPADNTVISANTTYSVQVCAVDDSGNNGVLQIGANSITLDCAGTVFVGSRRGIAIVNNGYDSVTIKNCLMSDYNVGIWLYGGANSNVLRSNDINRTEYGIHIMSASTDVNIWDSNIDANNSIGIYVAQDSNRAWIKDNNVSDNNKYGISILSSGDINVFRNTIRRNGTASTDAGLISDSTSGDLNIADNNILYNLQTGLSLSSSRNNIKDNNIWWHHTDGIYLNGSDSNLTGNFVAWSEDGIDLQSAADRTKITSNTLREHNWAGINAQGSANDINIHKNTLGFNNKFGISTGGDSNWSITDNNVGDYNSIGISTHAADSNFTISDNNIITSKALSTGIDIMGSSIFIIDNNISSNLVADTANIHNHSNGPVTIRTNSIRNSSNGITLYGNNTHIEGNEIKGNIDYGVIFSNGVTDVNIISNSITNNGNGDATDSGIYMSNLLVASSDANIVDNNIAYNNQYGVYGSSSGGITVKDSNFTGNRIAFYANSGSNYLISGSTFRQNTYAVWLSTRASDMNLLSSTIDKNNSYGIYLNTSVDDINVSDTNISDNNKIGFWALVATDINLANTTVKNNTLKDINLSDANISFIDGNYGTLELSGTEEDSVDINSRIDRYWRTDVNAARSDTYAAIADANMDVNSQYGVAQTGRLVAGSNGNFQQIMVKQYDQNFSSTAPYYYTPHKFIVGHDAYDTNTYTKTIDSNYDITIYLAPRGVSITSPKAGEVLSNPNVTFTYLASAGFSPVNKYWVRLDDQPLYTSNGTSTTYGATLTSGAHTFYVKANGPQDVNSPVASVSFTINLGPGVAACGDGVCGSGETAASCAADCPPICGDNACTGTETPDTCPADCAVGCGDGVCDDAAGETCSGCPGDCGVCLPGELPPEIPGEEDGIQQPTSPFPGQMGKPACAGVKCDDNNPCTTDICFEGECSYINKQEGTTCGFGMECLAGTCVPALLRAAGIPRIPIATDVASMLVSVLRLLGGDALEKAPLALALLIALAVIAAMLAYNRLRIFMPAETLSTRLVQMLTAARAGVAILFFAVPFVVNRMIDVNAGITAAIIEIAIILLVHYLKKRSMERKAIKV